MLIKYRPNRCFGFSLIELMVGLVLGLLTTGVVMTIFVSNHNVFRTDDGITRVQENAKFIQEFIVKNIRMSGFRGCLSKQQTSLVNTLNMATNLAFNFSQGIEGVDNIPNTLPANILAYITAAEPRPLVGTDMLFMRGPIGTSVNLSQNNSDSSVFTEIVPNKISTPCNSGGRISDLCFGDIVMISDCKKSRMFQINSMDIVSGAGSTQTLSIGHSIGGTISPGNLVGAWSPASNKQDSFNSGSEVIPYQTQALYVATNPITNQNALYRKINNQVAQVLVDSVRDLQISYGIDTNADRQVDSYVTAASVSNWGNVVSVRIALLLFSSEDGILNSHQTINFNNATVLMPDTRWYLPVTITATLRNRIS